MPPVPPVTRLAELAAIAGVSMSTVSRALAGNPLIGAATRARIVALAAEHGFEPNRAARNLRMGLTGAIGVVLPLGHEADQSLSDPFFAGLLGPLADALAQRGHDMLLRRVIPRDDRWLDAMIDGGRCDGLILIGQSDQIDVIERAARRHPPLVVWGAAVPGYAQLTVGSDNRAGGRLAAAHLLARGRRRLAFFGNPAVPEFAARHAGFLDAATGVPGVTVTLHPVHLTTEAAHAEIAEFLASHPAPDGIVAASDVIAMSALRALGEHGVDVPGDVAIVGYDDVGVARHTNPPLTTVRQDVAAGAALLVERLFQRLAGEPAESVMMPPELVIRASA